VLLVVGFLAELITNRHYKEGTDVPIIERIDPDGSKAEEKVVPISSGQDQISPSAKPKILVADDDQITRALSTRILTQEGWDISTAETGEEALGAITPDIHVVLLDIYLPGLSGIEVLPKIKQLAPRDGADAIKAGALDFLSKPVKKEELLETLDRALKTSRSLRPEEGQAAG